MKHRYIYGIELVECKCGVWRVPDMDCWNEYNREQSTIEAMAQFQQSVRNLGYNILKPVIDLLDRVGK